MSHRQRFASPSLRLSRLGAPPEFVTYVLVSGLALLVDYLVYWLTATQWGLSLPTAATFGYLTGLAFSYVLVRGRVFRDGWLRARPLVEATLYTFSGLLGLALTYGTSWTYVSLFGEHLMLAKLCALAVSFVGVYAFRAHVIFRRPCLGEGPAHPERTKL